jgi:formate dehydrogenase iron-sulfur subunit
MSGYSVLVDTSRCTACRGCQIACKQWNQLPGLPTKNMGSHQNPMDLNFDTYRVVRFTEGKQADDKPFWYFFTDSCRHCLTPGCMSAVQDDEIIQDEKTGAVLFSEKTKNIDFKTSLEGCPFNIPRQDPKTKVMSKCTFCFDRITNELPPACVKSCPTGALVFGERDKILDLVKQRVEELKPKFPKTQALRPDETRFIFIVTDDPNKYYEWASGK